METTNFSHLVSVPRVPSRLQQEMELTSPAASGPQGAGGRGRALLGEALSPGRENPLPTAPLPSRGYVQGHEGDAEPGSGDTSSNKDPVPGRTLLSVLG